MTKKTTKSLADRIRAEIAARGISGYRVSKETGLSETGVARFLRGDGVPTLENVEKLLAFLGWEVVESKRPEGK